MQLLQYLLVLHFTFCLLWMIFQLNIARRKVTFQTLQVNNTSHKVLKAVVTLLTKQPLTSTTQLLMARNVKLMNYTAVEKYESTSRLVLLQRIR